MCQVVYITAFTCGAVTGMCAAPEAPAPCAPAPPAACLAHCVGLSRATHAFMCRAVGLCVLQGTVYKDSLVTDHISFDVPYKVDEGSSNDEGGFAQVRRPQAATAWPPVAGSTAAAHVFDSPFTRRLQDM